MKPACRDYPEVFERYVKSRIIAERISLPAILEEVLARYPQVTESIHRPKVSRCSVLMPLVGRSVSGYLCGAANP